MRTHLLISVAAIALLLTFPGNRVDEATAQGEDCCCEIVGDWNDDSIVDQLDLLNLHIHIKGGVSLPATPPCFRQADVTGDCALTSLDEVVLDRYLYLDAPDVTLIDCPTECSCS